MLGGVLYWGVSYHSNIDLCSNFDSKALSNHNVVMAKPKLCVLCMDKRREFRLRCGHMFSCTDCIKKLEKCIYCPQPLTSAYAVYLHSDGELSSGDDDTFDPDFWSSEEAASDT